MLMMASRNRRLIMDNKIMCEWCREQPAMLVHRVERQEQRQMKVTLLDGTIILDNGPMESPIGCIPRPDKRYVV
jgi:hypothetical protein